ncbi:GNAT family N-acetyltransferase [Natrarchaeobius chitinivorans]|uniref:GNAT family N-acetyltransferase n=1 Tax=Natrarchaeobius chitinivorans TaxID=1679083 RepID=A0A3N6N6M2_NATCH|nr:GNAT family N-acetyltransferase [Natrarchaeobius chitinivorans]RQG94022.1 GNAT family N-acetyltransferase [Natrarchaeobius chitinivorans]
MTDVESGPVDSGAVHAFLEETFDGWGDERLFDWKYEQYPGFDPDDHCYYVADDDLAAFRRVFPKELVVDGKRVRATVFGDTAVREDHRGEGLYSKLLARTGAYSRNVAAGVSVTYNHTGNVTFDTKVRRGWNYSVLPLKLLVHSYTTVLETYADRALPAESRLTEPIGTVGDWVVLQTPTQPVVVSEIFGETPTPGRRRLEVHADATAIARLVEQASNASLPAAVLTGSRQLLSRSGGLSVVSPNHDHDLESSEAAVDVDVVDPGAFSVETVTAVTDLARFVRAGSPSFRRERRDIEHMLAYPDADALLVFEEGDPVGFAVVGPYETDGVREARVLDLLAPSPAIYRQLVSKLERLTAARGYDLVVMVSQREPGPEWASVDRQVVMWNDHDRDVDDSVASVMPPVVSMYDVV